MHHWSAGEDVPVMESHLMDLDEVVRILASLEREGVDYAVFGGVALNFHGIEFDLKDEGEGD